jgi:hypothetical protein
MVRGGEIHDKQFSRMPLQYKLCGVYPRQHYTPSVQFVHDTKHLLLNLLLYFSDFPDWDFTEPVPMDPFDKYQIDILVFIQLALSKVDSIPTVTSWNHIPLTIFQF